MHPKNKRGVSEVVGYVLLVVIAIGLSIGVYSYLRVFVPKEKPECQEDIHLIVQGYSYHHTDLSTDLSITLANKGLFNISSAYVRLGAINRTTRYPIGADKGKVNFGAGLGPGISFPLVDFTNDDFESLKEQFSSLILGEEMMLEIQPVVLSAKGENVLCPNAVITQKITSTLQ